MVVPSNLRGAPAEDGFSLYLRPTGISTHAALGVAVAKSAKMYVIMSPVGPYYPEGFAPVKLLAEAHYSRAWPGGTGDSKIGGCVLACAWVFLRCVRGGVLFAATTRRPSCRSSWRLARASLKFCGLLVRRASCQVRSRGLEPWCSP